jgi:drug/metabolite transporter (DMT)-like permease
MVLACLLAVYIIWGTTYFAIKVVVQGGLPTFFFVGSRFIASGGALLLWQIARRGPLPTPRQWLNSALVGILLLGVGNGGVTIAEQWVSSGATVALLSIIPLITAGLSGLFGERTRALEWVAMLLGSGGIAVMLLGKDLQASHLGTAVLLISALSWSFGTVVSRRLDIPTGAAGFGAEMFCTGLLATLISLARGEPWTLPAEPQVWAGWGYLVVFGSIVGFSAFRYLVERVSATLAVSYAYVNPPVALLVGWWLGNERFSLPLLAGLPIVLGAVGLQAWVHTHALRATG